MPSSTRSVSRAISDSARRARSRNLNSVHSPEQVKVERYHQRIQAIRSRSICKARQDKSEALDATINSDMADLTRSSSAKRRATEFDEPDMPALIPAFSRTLDINNTRPTESNDEEWFGGSASARPTTDERNSTSQFSSSIFGNSSRKFGQSTTTTKTIPEVKTEASPYEIYDVRIETEEEHVKVEPASEVKTEPVESDPPQDGSPAPSSFNTTNSFVNIGTPSNSNSTFDEPEDDDDDDDEVERLNRENADALSALHKVQADLAKAKKELYVHRVDESKLKATAQLASEELNKLKTNHDALIKNNQVQGDSISKLRSRLDTADKEKSDVVQKLNVSQAYYASVKKENTALLQAQFSGNSDPIIKKFQSELAAEQTKAARQAAEISKALQEKQNIEQTARQRQQDLNRIISEKDALKSDKQKALDDARRLRRNLIDKDDELQCAANLAQVLTDQVQDLKDQSNANSQLAIITTQSELHSPPKIEEVSTSNRHRAGMSAAMIRTLDSEASINKRWQSLNGIVFTDHCPKYTHVNEDFLGRFHNFFDWTSKVVRAVQEKFGIEFGKVVLTSVDIALSHAQWFWRLSEVDQSLFKGKKEISNAPDPLTRVVVEKLLVALPQACGENREKHYYNLVFDEYQVEPLRKTFHSVPGVLLWLLIYHILPSRQTTILNGITVSVETKLAYEAAHPKWGGKRFQDEQETWFNRLKLISRIFGHIKGLDRERVFKIFYALEQMRRHQEGHLTIRKELIELRDQMTGPTTHDIVKDDIEEMQDLLERYKATMSNKNSFEGSYDIPLELKHGDQSDAFKKDLDRKIQAGVDKGIAKARQIHTDLNATPNDNNYNNPNEGPAVQPSPKDNGSSQKGTNSATATEITKARQVSAKEKREQGGRWTSVCPRCPITNSKLYQKFANPQDPNASHKVCKITKAWATQYCEAFENGFCKYGTSCSKAHVCLLPILEEQQDFALTAAHFEKATGTKPTKIEDIFHCWSAGAFGHSYNQVTECKACCKIDDNIMHKKPKTHNRKPF